MTPAAAAKILGVTPETVSRWADQGVLPFFRLKAGQRRHRRFRESDVLALLAEMGSDDKAAS